MRRPAAITVRDTDPGRDIEGLSRTLAASFHRSFWPLFDQSQPELVHHLMRGLLAMSPQSLVAIDGRGEVAGFLLGTIGIDLRAPLRSGAVFADWLVSGIIGDRFEISPPARRFLVDLARDYLPVLISGLPNSRPACEVNVFAVGPGHQGRGIGKRLMDEFARQSRTAGARRVFLVTDTTLSWQFYPAYGFEEVKRAPMRRAYRTSLPDEADSVVASVYALDLRR